jgi:predicted NBD/HSP70 family sugar kinase
MSSPTESEIHRGLEDLFSLAKHGHRKASAVVEQAAYYIGMAIAALLTILDIPNVIIAADFGLDGDAIIPYINREVNYRIIPGLEYSVVYYPLERLGFAQGAALLILKEYFTNL